MSSDEAVIWLSGALGLQDGETPFPWQERLLADFRKGIEWSALDIPRGLGKTSVMAIWLIARAAGVRLTRSLVYVVDSRAVVDQATEAARGMRAHVWRLAIAGRDSAEHHVASGTAEALAIAPRAPLRAVEEGSRAAASAQVRCWARRAVALFRLTSCVANAQPRSGNGGHHGG